MPVLLHARRLSSPDSAQSPILILHGLFGSGTNWHSIARDLSAEHTVTTLDLRNHGRSAHDPAMDYPALAADVAAFMHAENVPQAVVIGHSMGGKVAMTLALDRPELVARLVVVDIAPVAYAHDYRRMIDAMLGLKAEALASRAKADAALREAIPDADVRGFVLQNLVRDGNGYRWRINLAAIAGNMTLITGFPTFANGQHFSGPVLFVHGELSEFVRSTHAPRIRELFPQAEIVTIADSGHWLHAEAPARFLKIVAKFLEP